MKFLHRKYPAKRGEAIEVHLNAAAIVKFMTAKEFKHYGAGRTHTYYRGQAVAEGIRFVLPFDGIWHAVVEKGNGEVTASCKHCPPAPGLEQPVLEQEGAEAAS
ncbi:MAG TPA: DUF1883 domain-containing protein [Flavobacteriales bacterium]|nr:DUF1883 domain-containing protein [Flavobacteriales bacterium]HRN35315.1 DUF1883 domain-containing protein [Flavobacteriales bacterium]HRO38294.1 DUF1883 domain-containing protein [Flavobacteriales bacterium]HRP80459.1 DUF1883 domain-containing protein [Flavobacteriales bacterium]HRQ85769.1 DUF1883 domain-containing protein [Flavobacteriales bacterium]